jgi:acyl carrier protein
MTTDSIRQTVLRVLGTIAPEVDPATLDPSAPFRNQLDLDSIDFLNFLIALRKELGVDVPERDYSQLGSLNACVEYLAAALRASQTDVR